ncbi:MAG: hypothetical protein U0Q16_27560 [Bryobacteraceae bacterium]
MLRCIRFDPFSQLENDLDPLFGSHCLILGNLRCLGLRKAMEDADDSLHHSSFCRAGASSGYIIAQNRKG